MARRCCFVDWDFEDVVVEEVGDDSIRDVEFLIYLLNISCNYRV